MSRRTRWTTALAAAGISLTLLLPKPSAYAGERNAAALGQRIYQAQCAQCHGTAGKGDGRAACDFRVRPTDLTELETADESDSAVIRKILHARRPMPQFDSILSGDQRQELAQYLRLLSKDATSGRGDRP